MKASVWTLCQNSKVVSYKSKAVIVSTVLKSFVTLMSHKGRRKADFEIYYMLVLISNCYCIFGQISKTMLLEFRRNKDPQYISKLSKGGDSASESCLGPCGTSCYK